MITTIIRQTRAPGIVRLHGSDGRIYYPPASRSKIVDLRCRVFRVTGPCAELWAKAPSSIGLKWSTPRVLMSLRGKS